MICVRKHSKSLKTVRSVIYFLNAGYELQTITLIYTLSITLEYPLVFQLSSYPNGYPNAHRSPVRISGICGVDSEHSPTALVSKLNLRLKIYQGILYSLYSLRNLDILAIHAISQDTDIFTPVTVMLNFFFILDDTLTDWELCFVHI